VEVLASSVLYFLSLSETDGLLQCRSVATLSQFASHMTCDVVWLHKLTVDLSAIRHILNAGLNCVSELGMFLFGIYLTLGMWLTGLSSTHVFDLTME